MFKYMLQSPDRYGSATDTPECWSESDLIESCAKESGAAPMRTFWIRLSVKTPLRRKNVLHTLWQYLVSPSYTELE
ncbi:hypothetical protein COOONC_15229 [Cooperia oncophora]